MMPVFMSTALQVKVVSILSVGIVYGPESGLSGKGKAVIGVVAGYVVGLVFVVVGDAMTVVGG